MNEFKVVFNVAKFSLDAAKLTIERREKGFLFFSNI